jgi:phage anti-repressor protein
MITSKCFKLLCMLSHTRKGKKVRLYFYKIEEYLIKYKDYILDYVNQYIKI